MESQGSRVRFPVEIRILACFLSLQVVGALANEIKHDHSHEVIVVLDPRYN